MDRVRIVLPAPSAEAVARPELELASRAATAAFFVAVLASVVVDAESWSRCWIAVSPSSPNRHSLRPQNDTNFGGGVVVVVVVGFAIIAASIASVPIGTFLRRRLGFGSSSRRIAEAAVEITPLGVQLVSIRGTTSEVRAFIPLRRILDVVVTEVVWPHCVWSQVAFRVARGNDDGGTGTSRGSCNDGDGPTIHNVQHANKANVHDFLQRDRVAIVPAFPEECRGTLTYERCLLIQAEIEKLLGKGIGVAKK